MTVILLLIWFYLYIGVLFGVASMDLTLFPKLKWLVQVLFWPALTAVYVVKRVRESDFGWFVRYGIFKLTH